MAYNNSFQESEVNEPTTQATEPGSECPSKKQKNLDFVDDWLNVSVENEVCRGKKLRQQKPIPNHSENECSFISVDFMESFCNKSGRSERTSPCTPRSKSPIPRTNSVTSSYSPMNIITRSPKVTKNSKRCPMRIAELAVPTKRQCIDTWRNKSYLLPEFMVERLKQHVMDQRPIVKIPEAITCFQRRRTQSKTSPQCKKENNKQALSHLQKKEAKTFCLSFAHKIATILSKPRNIQLNSDLEKVYTIVASEIATVMSKTECPCKKVNRQYEWIHKDISNKITIWIAGILEDLKGKLLEEDLRAEKMKKPDEIITIMEAVFCRKSKTITTDLEEEEGPALDFLDDVVDTVMNICEPPTAVCDGEIYFSDSSKGVVSGDETEKPALSSQSSDNKTTIVKHIINIDTEDAVKDVIHSLIEEINTKDTDENFTDIDHIRNIINNIICIIIKQSKDDIDKGENSGEDINKGSEDELEIDNNEKITPEAVDHNEDHENTGQTNYGLENGITIDDAQMNDTQLNIELNHDKEETVDKETNDSNVSGGFEIFSEDSDGDKNSKKVMFSMTDLVNPDNSNKPIKPSLKDTHESQGEHIHSKPHHDKNSIVFAEPNENLLSDADESWPPDLNSDRPPLKVSDSASKSVTSLGNIAERDEKHSTSPDSDTYKDSTDDSKSHEEDMNDNNKLLIIHSIDNLETSTQTSKTMTKESKQTITMENEATLLVDTILYEEKPNNKHINVPNKTPKPADKTCEKEIYGEDIKYTKITKADEIELVNSADKPKHSEIPCLKTQSQMHYGWKVHPKTAPSWVVSGGHGRGEPSEDSLPVPLITKVKESDLRKWCKDLEKAFLNLEMWSNWISSTCQETIFLNKQKEIKCTCFRRKTTTNWIRLKKNIHKDAILWTKLYQRTEDNFRFLKRKYHNIEYNPELSGVNTIPEIHNAIIEMMHDFEDQSVMLHKLIVTAEYSAMCNCYNKTKACCKYGIPM